MKAFKYLLLSALIVVMSAVLVLTVQPWHRRSVLWQRLQTVDSLCDDHPSESLKILDSIENNGLLSSEYEMMKFALLRTKAHDKARDVHRSDSVMKGVVKFFDEHGSPAEKMEAYYYMGSVYRDMHDSPSAMKWYLKATEYGEQELSDISVKTLRNAYSQLSYLFHRQHFDSLALVAAKREYALSADSLTHPQTPMDLGTQYMMAGQADSAFLYYEKSFAMIRRMGAESRYLRIIATQMSQYAMHGMKAEADLRMAVIEQYPDLCRSGLFAWERAIYYSYLAQNDSAISAFRVAAINAEDDARKANAAKHLLRLFADKDEADSVKKYALLYAELQDTVYEQKKMERTANVLHEYHYRREQEAEEAAYRRAIQAEARGWMAVALSLLVVGFAAIVFVVYRRRMRNELSVKEKERDRLLNQWEDEMRMRKAIDVDSSEVIRDLRHCADSCTSCPEELWKRLIESVEKTYPDLKQRLISAKPDVTAKDIKVFYLSYLGFSSRDISALMGVSHSTVNRHVRLLRDLLT